MASCAQHPPRPAVLQVEAHAALFYDSVPALRARLGAHIHTHILRLPLPVCTSSKACNRAASAKLRRILVQWWKFTFVHPVDMSENFARMHKAM